MFEGKFINITRYPELNPHLQLCTDNRALDGSNRTVQIQWLNSFLQKWLSLSCVMLKGA